MLILTRDESTPPWGFTGGEEVIGTKAGAVGDLKLVAGGEISADRDEPALGSAIVDSALAEPAFGDSVLAEPAFSDSALAEPAFSDSVFSGFVLDFGLQI